MKEYNLINFGYNPWGFFWKRNQTIFYLLSREVFIDRALFVNSAVWPIDLLQTPRKQLSQPHINNWKYIVPRAIDDKITSYTPSILPFAGRYRIMDRISLALSRQVYARYQSKPVILLVNTPIKGMWKNIDLLFPHAAVKIFDWSDDHEQFTDNQSEKEIVAKAIHYYVSHSDLVITINERLTQKAKKLNPDSFTLPNATNMFTFPAGEFCGSLPSPLRYLQKPIVGYMGWLNEMRLDLELIEYLARSRATWNFFFIGPESHKDPLGPRIRMLPNVHIVKPVAYQLLASVLALCDVCILPNKINAHTSGNDPIKIYDYLATGKPLVSTRTAGTERLSDYIYLADTQEEFLAHLDRVIAGNDPIAKEIRMRVAYENSWKHRFEEFLPLLKGHLKKESPT